MISISKRIVALGLLGAVVVASVLTLATVLAGSTNSEVASSSLRVALPSFGAEVLDPSMDSGSGLNYHGHAFDHLVGASSDGRLSDNRGVSSAWSLNDDATSYQLSVRSGAKWHDGSLVTSGDVSGSIAYYVREESTCAICPYLRNNIASITPIGDDRIDLTLASPNVFLINGFGPIEGDAPLVHSDIGNAESSESLIGTGPWRFSERTLGESITFERNVDYFDLARIPQIDMLELTQVPGNDARVALAESGAVDIARITSHDVASAKANGLHVNGPKNVVSTTIRFFMSYDPSYLTSNPDFRQALAHGTDLARIVNEVYEPEAATVASGSALFAPHSPGYDPALPTYAFDSEKARDLLSSIGYNDQIVHLFSLAAYGQTEMPRVSDMIAEDWRNIGVNIEIVRTEFSEVQSRYLPKPQNFDDFAPAPLFHGASPARPGGMGTFIDRYLGSGETGMRSYYDPDKGDSISNEIRSITSDIEREARLRELNKEMYDEYWALPIVWAHDVYAISSSLRDWKPTNGTSSDLHFETVRLTP